MKFKDYFTGTIFIFLLGSLFHFTYELSNNNFLVALFSATNESVFSHSKLLLYPIIIWYIIFYFMNSYVNKNTLFSSMIINILVSTICIPIMYYTYTGIFGFNNIFIDLSIFFISIIIGFYYANKTYKKGILLPWKIILFLIILFFSYYTFFPLDIPYFI